MYKFCTQCAILFLIFNNSYSAPPDIPLKKNIQQYHINYTLYFWSGSLLQTLKIILDMNIELKFLKFSEMVEFIYDQLSH